MHVKALGCEAKMSLRKLDEAEGQEPVDFFAVFSEKVLAKARFVALKVEPDCHARLEHHGFLPLFLYR